jgi:hypothetical protein
MMKRWLIAIVLGALVLSDLSLAAASFGVGGTQGFVLGTTRTLDSERVLVTGLSTDAVRAGVHVGDIYDFRLLTPHQRAILFTDDGRVGSVITAPVVRAGRIATIRVLFSPRDSDAATRTAHVLSLMLLFLAAFVGLFIVVRGKGNGSLAAGIMLLGFALYESRSFSRAIAPDWLNLSTEILWSFSFVGFPAAAFVMAQYCLPEKTSQKLRTWLWVVFGVITLAAIFDEQIEWPVLLFTGHSLFGFNLYYQLPLVASFALTLVTLAVAAATSRGTGAAAVRVLFVSSLVGLGAECIFSIAQILAGNMGLAVPTWALYGLLVTWSLLFAGYSYAIFASRVYDVDFFINRSIVYATVIVIVVGILALVESLIERAALGRVENAVLSLTAPVLIGLSARWIGQRVEGIVERTFFRHKIIAHDRLRALAEDFAEAHEAEGLAERVAHEIHKQFNAQTVVYRFTDEGYTPYAAGAVELDRLQLVAQDDPVFMRLRRSRSPVDTRQFETALPYAGLVFPLVVLGRVYGAILAGRRPHDQWYDPDDQEVIATVAHELGIALLWLHSDALPVPQPN